jgi:hypothetical protein
MNPWNGMPWMGDGACRYGPERCRRAAARYAACILTLLLAVATGGCGDSGGSTPTTPTPTATLPPMSVMLAEKSLGSATKQPAHPTLTMIPRSQLERDTAQPLRRASGAGLVGAAGPDGERPGQRA